MYKKPYLPILNSKKPQHNVPASKNNKVEILHNMGKELISIKTVHPNVF